MSTVIPSEVDKFTDTEFVSDGDWNRQPSHMEDYFPGSGVRMSVARVDVFDINKQFLYAYGKVTISSSPAKNAIQTAVYRVEGDRLVAKDIELGPGLGLLMDETLTAVLDPQTKVVTAIRHELKFSDGTAGYWTCKRP